MTKVDVTLDGINAQPHNEPNNATVMVVYLHPDTAGTALEKYAYRNIVRITCEQLAHLQSFLPRHILRNGIIYFNRAHKLTHITNGSWL